MPDYCAINFISGHIFALLEDDTDRIIFKDRLSFFDKITLHLKHSVGSPVE